MSTVTGDNEKRKRMVTGLTLNSPLDIKTAIQMAYEYGYHFIVTQITHPNYARDLKTPPPTIGRTDRILQSTEWNRLVVGELTSTINVDSEIEHVALKSKQIFLQEIGFALHLGLPIIKLSLNKRRNPQLSRIINEKLIVSLNPFTSVWITIPMVHPSQFSPICEEDERQDTWDWWDDFRTYCNYDKHLCLALELPDVRNIPDDEIIDRWIGEPVKVLIIPSSLFLLNANGKQVLSKRHQEVIQRFLALDVQYIIKSDGEDDLSAYPKYLYFLGKKLYLYDSTIEFAQGVEDYLQNPLQPLTEHLETNVYEVFEKDQIKYTSYQNAVHRVIEDMSVPEPVVMVVGAGRGPLVQAVLNVSYILHRKIKVYAVEKNPFAINTLIDRNENEWNNQVTLINEDMRFYEPPEKADVLVSELLGSFGDNELSPECLDGAQRFLKPDGVTIPTAYTSYLAPLQSIRIFNEIRANRPNDKTLISCLETPYVVRLVNYFQIAPPQALFKFSHPNWNQVICNERYKKLKFCCRHNCVLTGFVGFFDTVLYKDVFLSIHPDTHTKEMVSWFPIVFPIQEPIHVSVDSVIEVSFWRVESPDKVWYEWCLESPVKGPIANPGGRSFFIKKH